MSYFKNYPTVNINGVEALDITRRARLGDVIQDGVLDYMSYTVKEGERPEDVAYYYYDDPSLAWLVLMANDIVDPYTEWPKSQENLHKYIIAQYAEQSGYVGQQVMDWSMDRTISANIVHYKSQYDSETFLNRASFVALGNSHTITADKIIKDQTYTINNRGTISDSNWLLLTGGTNSTVGNTFTAAVNGENIFFADTAEVVGTSITNPAREFVAVRVYDYEWETNEAKREIELVNKGLVPKLLKQFETILKDD
jgi:hypothetical protein